MDLFNNSTIIPILPFDGIAEYHGAVMSKRHADRYFELLLTTTDWRNDEAIIFGKRIITKRKVAWYGDDGFSYTYSKVTKQALPWTGTLLELKSLAEGISKTTFNSCLLNLYHNGDEGVGWHSDDEKSLLHDRGIASLSFGAERKFSFRHKVKDETHSIMLSHGSLLVMKEATQTNWLHSLLKSKKILKPRINLTFRTIAGTNIDD